MHSLAFRYFMSLGSVAASLVLGVVALAWCAIYNEQLLLGLFKTAAAVRDWLVSFKNWPKMEIIARFVLHESSILLMFFTLMSRAVIGLMWLVVAFIRGQ